MHKERYACRGLDMGMLQTLQLAMQVLTPAQAAIMFILDNEAWIVEPLQISNLLALSRGIILESSDPDEQFSHHGLHSVHVAKQQQLPREELNPAHIEAASIDNT